MSRQFAHLVSNKVDLSGAVGCSLRASAGQVDRVLVRKDKRLYKNLFGHHYFRSDDNGGVGPGDGFWRLIADVEDRQYAVGIYFDTCLYCWFHYDGSVLSPYAYADYVIPNGVPRVFPEVWNLSRNDDDDLPVWPLNGICREEQPILGGGYTGRVVRLRRLRLQGALKSFVDFSDPDISNTKYWDNVRIMVVMDYAPVIISDPAYVPTFKYKGFMHDLFLLPNVGVAVNLNPQGRARFTVLYDEVYSWTAQRNLHSFAQPLSKTVGRLSTVASGDPEADPPVPPSDSAAVFGFNLYEKGTISLNGGVFNHGHRGAFQVGNAGIIIADASVGVYSDVVSVAGLGCTSTTKSSDQTNLVSAHMRATSESFPILESEVATGPLASVDLYQHARTSVIGPGGVNVDVDLDLSRYYTVFNRTEGILAGALWLVVVSDNGASAFFPFKDRAGENPLLERSGLDVCVTYVEE